MSPNTVIALEKWNLGSLASLFDVTVFKKVPSNEYARIVEEKGVGMIGPATVGGIKPGCIRIGNTGPRSDLVAPYRTMLGYYCCDTRGACCQGPGTLKKCPKWLREGAKGLSDPGRQSPPALVQKRVTPVQNRVVGGAKDSWETFAPWVRNTSPNHLGHCGGFGPL